MKRGEKNRGIEGEWTCVKVRMKKETNNKEGEGEGKRLKGGQVERRM